MIDAFELLNLQVMSVLCESAASLIVFTVAQAQALGTTMSANSEISDLDGWKIASHDTESKNRTQPDLDNFRHLEFIDEGDRIYGQNQINEG